MTILSGSMPYVPNTVRKSKPMDADQLADHWMSAWCAVISGASDPDDYHDTACDLADKAIEEMSKRHAQWLRNAAGVP